MLSVTSASGTSSADLVGPQGPTGAAGPTGPAGADGTTFTPQSPLSLPSGVLAIDLSDYLEVSDLPLKLWAGATVPSTGETGAGSARIASVGMTGVAVGDLILNFVKGVISQVTSVGDEYFGYKGVVEIAQYRGIVATTDIDLAEGVTGSAYVNARNHPIFEGTLLLNTTSGNLMKTTMSANPRWDSGGPCSVTAIGLGNIYNANVSGGATYTASSPLSIDANNDISIDLSAYAALAGATFTGAVSGIAPTANAHVATKKYEDDAIAALDDLSGVSF